MNATKHMLDAMSKKRRNKGTLKDEVAALSKGDPLAYDSYMRKTRYDMWLIGLGGAP
jgi:precorrin-2 methylase